MQPVSFDNDFECQNVVEEFTFEDEGKDYFTTQDPSLNPSIQ